MKRPTLDHSRKVVNAAGDSLRVPPDRSDVDNFFRYFEALDVLSNWRSAHNYPLNTFQATLRSKLKKLEASAFVAQRLKRTPSIILKLRRFGGMRLVRMQDIGGLRAVVSTVGKVRELEALYRRARFEHELVRVYDYIKRPKETGYRGLHMAYKYKNGARPEYDGLLIELQFRTHQQHAWATAVETVGTFVEHALKSSEGPQEWLDFFALAGAAFARLERTAPVPGYEVIDPRATYRRVARAARALKVRETLEAYSVAQDHIKLQSGRGSSYHLIVLDPVQRTVDIESFRRDELSDANDRYLEVEKDIDEGESVLQAVLVSAGALGDLRRAYPNYFLDTQVFMTQLDRIERLSKKK